MREEFEKVFPVPEGVAWVEQMNGYVPSASSSFMAARQRNEQLAVWQAATALQAERVAALEAQRTAYLDGKCVCPHSTAGSASHYPGCPQRQAERVRELEEALVELQRKYEKVMEPTCFSVDGDYWFDCPNDIEFVEDRKVGEEFELITGLWSQTVRFRVTKVPDEMSDDYEVEQALSATAQEGGK